MDIVTDLTVPEELLADAKVEADTLPKLEINKLDLQWLQVYPRTVFSGHRRRYRWRPPARPHLTYALDVRSSCITKSNTLSKHLGPGKSRVKSILLIRVNVLNPDDRLHKGCNV